MLQVLGVAAATAAISCGLPIGILYLSPLAKHVNEDGPFDPITRRLLLTVTTVLIWILLVYLAMHRFKPWAYHGVLLGILPLVAFAFGFGLWWLTHLGRYL